MILVDQAATHYYTLELHPVYWERELDSVSAHIQPGFGVFFFSTFRSPNIKTNRL
jgi:hypothetical protein